MTALLDARDLSANIFSGNGRVGEVSAGIVVAGGVDAHALRQAGIIAHLKAATRRKMTALTYMDVRTQINWAGCDDVRAAVDANLIADTLIWLRRFDMGQKERIISREASGPAGMVTQT